MEPNDAATSSARAHELRASLGTRREVEALLAEASATREAAAADADAIIEEAQQVSDQLLRESRAEADRLASDARQRAEGVVARARGEAEDITRQARAAADAVRARAEAQVEEHRRRVRAELTEQVTREVTEQSRRELARVQERQQSMIGDIEASVRILGVSMEAAVANIAEMLGALDSLRAHTAESLGDSTVPMTTPPRHADPVDELFRNTSEDAGDATSAGSSIFQNPDPAASVPPSRPVYDVSDEVAMGDRAEQDDVGALDDDDPPRTATEAFLRSAHIDHGDPPLPPMDDDEVGARYARDAMRATARADGGRDEETHDSPAERRERNDRPESPTGQSGGGERDDSPGDQGEAAAGDRAEATGKPLGWLFRSSS
jgi:cell division septum initiation protein DivIVA